MPTTRTAKPAQRPNANARHSLPSSDEALASRPVLELDGEGWARLHEALDAPERATPRLDRLMREPSVLERR